MNGLAVGAIYGLTALGFVLIYKATEVVNFAQGDLLMLGAFIAWTLIVPLGLPYILAFVLTIVLEYKGYRYDGYRAAHGYTMDAPFNKEREFL